MDAPATRGWKAHLSGCAASIASAVLSSAHMTFHQSRLNLVVAGAEDVNEATSPWARAEEEKLHLWVFYTR